VHALVVWRSVEACSAEERQDLLGRAREDGAAALCEEQHLVDGVPDLGSGLVHGDDDGVAGRCEVAEHLHHTLRGECVQPCGIGAAERRGRGE